MKNSPFLYDNLNILLSSGYFFFAVVAHIRLRVSNGCKKKTGGPLKTKLKKLISFSAHGFYALLMMKLLQHGSAAAEAVAVFIFLLTRERNQYCSFYAFLQRKTFLPHFYFSLSQPLTASQLINCNHIFMHSYHEILGSRPGAYTPLHDSY